MNSELTWRKSSYSGSSGGECVEVAARHGHILVRDTKAHDRGPVHQYPAPAWLAFITTIKTAKD
jgi:hypothetical protein